MIIQVGGLAEEFPTISTLPRPLSSVDSLMLIKGVFATEGLSAFAALIKFLPIGGFWVVGECLILTGEPLTVFMATLSALSGLLSLGTDLRRQKVQYVWEIFFNIPAGKGIC